MVPGLDRGPGFTDPASGLRLEAYTPLEHPDLWRAYLDGAEVQYRRHGVEAALRRPLIEDGRRVSLFVLARDEDGAVLGGIRCHGPLAEVDDSAATWEMRQCARLDIIRRTIDEHIPGGLVEVKGAWAHPPGGWARSVSAALGRWHVHFMDWFAAQAAVCTCSDLVAAKWMATGAVAVSKAGTAPYPDERYRTLLLLWERSRVAELASPENLERLAEERLQLSQ